MDGAAEVGQGIARGEAFAVRVRRLTGGDSFSGCHEPALFLGEKGFHGRNRGADRDGQVQGAVTAHAEVEVLDIFALQLVGDDFAALGKGKGSLLNGHGKAPLLGISDFLRIV